MSDSLTLLSSTISSLREVEEELLLYGVDMTQVLTQAHAASAEPGVHKLVSQFMEKEARVVELTKQVEEAAASTSMPVVCCPRSRTEMMMAGSRSADAWTQACEVFGTDSTVVALQDGKCVHWAKPDGVRRAPFYPLAPGWHHGKTYWNEMCDRGKPLPSASAGVGITAVCTDSGAFAIHSIEYGSPAYCSQMLREGDLLISIDGIVIKDLVTSEINRLLRGPSGSPVTVAAATPAAPGEVFYTYMTRRTVPTANKLGKGRLLCLVDKIFLEEEVAPATQLSVLRVRLRSARNLNVQRGSVFGIITLSTFSPIHEEQRHSTAPVQLSGSSASFEDETFSMDLHDPMRQRIEVQIFQQNTTRLEMSQAMGRAVLSAQDVVTATSEKRHQWWRLLSSDMNVVVGPGGAPCEVQISAEILSHAEAKARQQDAQGGLAPVEAQQQVQQSKDEARMAEALGVTLTIDDDYETMVGSTEEGMKRYSKELCLDLAAALYTSEDRFVVCGLSRGSIVVFLNIVADKDGVDLRPPKALAMLLKDQAADRNSLIRFASTTKGVRDVEISPAFNEPTVRSTARPKVAAGGPSRPLSPREHQQTPVHADDNERGGIGKVPAFGRPALALAPKDRAGVLLSGLAEGQLRAKNPALHKMPAVISLSFDDDHPASFGATTVQKIRLEAAKCIYLPASMVEVGEVDSVTRMVDVCIYPDNHLSRASGRSGEDDAKHRELAMQPGVQHVLASQLAGQVFEHSKSADHSNPMRDTEVLKHVVWAQCLKEPANLRTREVVAAMIGAEDVGAEAPVQEIADPRAEAELQAGNRGVGLTSTVPTDKKIWVSAPTLGSVWEELRDDNNIKYWISHRDSVVSKSNPSELWPLPPSWEQRVDDRRRLQYRFTSTGAWQFEHPCASAVVHGVLVLGKGACMVALRQLAKERGWVRLEEAFFASHPWAKGQLEFTTDQSDGYTTVYDRSQPRPGLPEDAVRVVAVYNLSCQYPNVPKVRTPALEAPEQGEDFPFLVSSMVDVTLKQYPERSYLVWRSTFSNKPPAGKDFTPVIISVHSAPGEVMHRLCHVVGPGGRASGFEPGWVLVDPNEEPWKQTAEELSEQGLVFESVGEILSERAAEYTTRIDPAAELPSSRRGERPVSDTQTTGAAEPFCALRRRVVRPRKALAPQEAAGSNYPDMGSHRIAQIEQELESLYGMQPPPPASARPSKRNEFIIELKRAREPRDDGRSGIGVGLQLENNPELPFFVTEIDTNGPAGMDGRMRVGDVLLRVQDTNVSGMTTNQVTDLVRGEPGSVVSLTLSRAEFSAEETRLREELGASSGAPPAQRQGRARKILSLDLKRGSPGEDGMSGIGMSLHPTIPADPLLPYIVHDLYPNGSAFEDGRVCVGDALLAVNGQSVSGLDMDQVAALIRGPASERVNLSLSREQEE
eukprot:Tamp_01670.p1 GENE.Tamp_01670~~Tamp_01670.p1  ORF type:complete len:1639 (-),score=327.70 Tamp_01670:137-4411(-)